MWPFKKSIRKRRIDIHKKAPSRPLAIWRRFSEAGGPVSVVLLLVFFAAVLFMDAWPMEPFGYRLGQHVPHDIHARVTFRVLSEQRLRQLRERTRQSTPATFRMNDELVDEIISRLRNLPERVRTTTQPADVEEPLRERFALEDPQQLDAWRLYADEQKRSRLQRRLDDLRSELERTLIVRTEDAAEQVERTANSVRVVRGEEEIQRSVIDLVGLDDTDKVKREVAQLASHLERDVRPSVEAYLLSIFVEQERPLYSYDSERTRADTEQAVARVTTDPPSEVYDLYERGDVLVERDRPTGLLSEPTGLTPKELDLLRTEHRQYVRTRRAQNPWLFWQQIGGRAVVLILVTALAVFYIVHYYGYLLTDHWRTFATVTSVLLLLGVNKLMLSGLQWNPHAAALSVLMGAIVFAIAFDQRFALAGGTILALLAVLQARASLGVLVVMLACVTVAVFQLREVRTRSKLLHVSGTAGAAALAVALAIGLYHGVPAKFALYDGLWAGGSALAVGLLAQAMLPGVERFFRVATSMTLLEWCDASKPLLRRLAMEAPGTYNHSLQLGAMCEAAADAIGARGLLARVGAYYHDIGKINKPDYFIENQTGASRHAKLSPAMSLLVIIGHVKDGLEMAREYGLPHELYEFIATHHGTTLVQYFYQQAAEQRKTDSDRAPDEVEFRYPGPKPRHKEPAILMLADASESSVRAMSDPTPGRIENQVHSMVSRRLQDGQLDECELTLKEVHQIETSLIKSLCSIYHSRIAYPTPPGAKPSAAETESTPKSAESGEAKSDQARKGGKLSEAQQRAGQE
ncbi:MAG: HD family phosphohydrolase [Phycisphaerae bacterium]